MSAKKGMSWIWPDVKDLETAKLANRQGVWAASFVSVVTAVFAALGAAGIQLFEFTFDALALIDACIFGVLAFGIYKMSRIASVAGLGLYIIERADMWINYGPKNVIIAGLLVLMFINSIRGTFAYHRLRKGTVEMGGNPKALELFAEFYSVVDSIYGVYLDSTRGFHLVKEQQITAQKQALQMLKLTQPELVNIEYLDKRPTTYGRGDPNKPQHVKLHTCTQAELKGRNEEGGANQKFIANMCLVSIYQYWDDHYRKEIAVVLGKDKNDLQSDIMGDIRLLRRSIIHHEAVCKKDVEKCKLLNWFKKGDEIFIDKEKFEQVISHIYNYIIEAMNESQNVQTR